MEAANSQVLRAGAEAFGIHLTDPQVAQFAAYLALLQRWNERVNLTRIIAPGEVVAKHFLDSLAIVPHLDGAKTLLDVGSGGGFPGAVAAIACPSLVVTLVESLQKKAAFLEALARDLRLPLVVEPKRLEQLTKRPFDAAVSRATFAPIEWVARGAEWVAPGGVLIAMLGRERPTLPTPAGFAPPEVLEYGLPVEADRALAIYRHG